MTAITERQRSIQDLATFKSSWLYGYALGVQLAEDEVRAAVRKHINGTGAWDGYRTAHQQGYRAEPGPA